MNLTFLDVIGWEYDVATPALRPLGGSQSALCYLAIELARRGHQVRFITSISQPRDVLGVRCIPLAGLSDNELAQPCDAFIVLNGPSELGAMLRPQLPASARLVLWMQHAFDQPAAKLLQTPAVRQAWDAIVCISEWQKATYIQQLGVPPAQIWILRNAMAPPFQDMFTTEEELIRAKSDRLVLAYTSAPYRGLEVLLDIFPTVRAEFPAAELQVYSSMRMYPGNEQADAFEPLYEQCRAMPGVFYQGSLSQPDLAPEMRPVSVLSYPNTFAETSCIAVMEALAAGAHVVTSDLGALPETTLGFATLAVPPNAAANPGDFAGHYLQQLRAVLARWRVDPVGFAAGHLAQVRQVNASCTWAVRAAEWEQAIQAWRNPTAGQARSA